jgi:hypothetical protein
MFFPNLQFPGLNNSGEAIALLTPLDNPDAVYSAVVNLSSGEYTTFTYATDGPFQSANQTTATAISDSGSIAGYYLNQLSYVDFLRSPDGSSVFSFVPTLAVTSSITSVGINQAEQITGTFYTPGPTVTPRGYIGNPISNTPVPPVISLTGVTTQQATFSIVDPVYGVLAIEIRNSNCSTNSMPWTPGQKTPILLTCTKLAPGRAIIAIQAWNTVGSLAAFDPAFLTVFGSGGPTAETLSDVPASEYVLSIANGDPGLKKLHLNVNGNELVVALKSRESLTMNLKPWMPLDSNTVAFSGDGSPDAQALIVLKESGHNASRRLRSGMPRFETDRPR